MIEFAEDTRTELERKAAQLLGVALIESLSYCVVLAFWLTGNQIGTSLAGFFHLWILASFMVMVVWITPGMRWPWWFAVLAFVTGPLGGVLVFWRIKRNGAPDRTRAPKTGADTAETGAP